MDSGDLFKSLKHKVSKKKTRESLTLPSKKKQQQKKKSSTIQPPPSNDNSSQENSSNGLESFLTSSNRDAQTFFPDTEMASVEEHNDPTCSLEQEEEQESVSQSISVEKQEEPQQQQQSQKIARPPRISPSVLLNDDELFNLDDNIVRRIIYSDCSRALSTEFQKKATIICINFTREHFEPGATKWYNLKEVYYDFLSSVFNALAFTTGKKVKLTPPDKVVEQAKEKPQRASKKRHADGDDDDNTVSVKMMETTPECEIDNFLKGDKTLTVFLETLMTGAQVSGYRWWIFDRSDSKTDNDAISLGLRESFLESVKIQGQVNKEMQAITKSQSLAKSAKAKKAATAKQYSITKEYAFSAYNTFESHFMGLVKRYFTKDPCLSVTPDNTTNTVKHREFVDTRDFNNHNTLLKAKEKVNDDYGKKDHPCNLSSLFSANAAMFYYVSAENVNESQCRLESYFSHKAGGRQQTENETAHTRVDFTKGAPPKYDKQKKKVASQASNIADVAEYDQSTKGEEFSFFPHESITYHVDNTFLSHEFMTRMPLPHRIGTTLYTQRDMISLKQQCELPLNVNEEQEANTENINTKDLSQLMKQMALDKEREKVDIYCASAEDNEVSYGETASYMGLHETELELTSDILLSQPHHTDHTLQMYLKFPVLPRDILDKFLTSKRNEIYARLKIILTHLGPKNRTVVAETMAAVTAAQEDTRNKSLSSMMLPPKMGDGRDQASHMMDQITHTSVLDENDANLLQLPYVSFSGAGLLRNRDKSEQIQRKVKEIQRRRALTFSSVDTDLMTDEERAAHALHEKKNYDAKIASGKPAYVREIIEQYRPYGNSLYILKTQLPKLSNEEVFLGRDIALRLGELKGYAYENLYKKFIDPETGKIPADKAVAFQRALAELKDALTVEAFNEFKENRNVSYACEGIRSDLMKRKMAYIPPDEYGGGGQSSHLGEQQFFGTPLPVHESRQEVRPWGEFRIWVQALFADIFGIAYNFKPTWIVYVASKHHCRYHPFCNSPKLNIGLTGNGMGGKSHILQKAKSVLPTGVGDMITHITDQAFNVDRNMNDMLLIYEEMQNKYFGFGNGNGKNGGDGTSAGSDRDTTNFFKSRLTSGYTSTMSWFENEETGMRDMKVSKAMVQGNMLFASNNDFTPADANVLTRFILLSVPKSKYQHEGERPQDKNKLQCGVDTAQDDVIVEQHKEIHRIYFLMEFLIKSRVLNDNVYGVNCDGGRIQRDLILDHLQKKYGISTNDPRKRDFILEFARCCTLLYAVWMGLTSPLTRHLQYDPHDPAKFIGFNPRVITEGIMPFMVVCKDQIIDAITSLNCLWYHDYQEAIIQSFATTHCRLNELRHDDFLVRSKIQSAWINMNASGGVRPKRGALTSSNGGGAFGNAYAANDDTEVDYNYIRMKGKTRDDIFKQLSNSLGDMIVASGDISKLLCDLEACRMENIDGYKLEKIPLGQDLLTGEDLGVKVKLIRDSASGSLTRPIVEFGQCPMTGYATCAILVHFIKQKLPTLFSDDLIENLNVPRKSVKEDDAQKSRPREEENDELNDMDIEPKTYEEKVREIGMVTMKDETLIIKAFKDIYENPVLEDPGMDMEVIRELEASYANPSTGLVPWRVYMTADAPKQALLTDFHPEMKEELDKLDDGNVPIRFVDELKMLPLKPRANGERIIIRNHNTISPSTQVALSIYKPREKQLVKRKLDDGTEITTLGVGEVLKKARVEEYSRTEAWELDRDIDAVSCREHLLNLGFQALESKPQYELVNYPPCTYMAVMEDKVQKEGTEGALLEYPFANNMIRIANKKKAAQALIKPDSVKYPKFTKFMMSNYAEGSERRLKAGGASLKIGTPIAKRSPEREKERREAFLREFAHS